MKNFLRPKQVKNLVKNLTVMFLALGLVIIATPGFTGQVGLNILFAVQGNVSIKQMLFVGLLGSQ
jgi:hypothetical protein